MRPKLSRYKYIRCFDNARPTPVLADTGGGPSKDFLLANGWAERRVPQEQLYDLLFEPSEAHNLAETAQHAGVLEETRGRPEKWIYENKDPILAGPIPTPTGAELNTRDQLSANDPTTTIA